MGNWLVLSRYDLGGGRQPELLLVTNDSAHVNLEVFSISTCWSVMSQQSACRSVDLVPPQRAIDAVCKEHELS